MEDKLTQLLHDAKRIANAQRILNQQLDKFLEDVDYYLKKEKGDGKGKVGNST